MIETIDQETAISDGILRSKYVFPLALPRCTSFTVVVSACEFWDFQFSGAFPVSAGYGWTPRDRGRYSGGRILWVDNMEEFGEVMTENAGDLHTLETPEHVMLRHHRRNLINAYHAYGDIKNETFFMDLLRDYSLLRPG